MTAHLHTYRYGPEGPARVLALHGLTGHGRRWEHIAQNFLPEVPIVAQMTFGLDGKTRYGHTPQLIAKALRIAGASVIGVMLLQGRVSCAACAAGSPSTATSTGWRFSGT